MTIRNLGLGVASTATLALVLSLLPTISPWRAGTGGYGVASAASDDGPQPAGRKAEGKNGTQARPQWTNSKLTGTPEPPPPYRLERAFPKLTFKNPVLLRYAPGLKRFCLIEQEGKLYSFPNDQGVEKADPLIDLTKELKSWDPKTSRGVVAAYGLAFHPKFEENRYCYICYVLGAVKSAPELPEGTRVSRFKVTATDPPRIDPASEKIVITWLAGGHNGCDLHFGRDGCLYISTGDATDPNPPDGLDTGQDVSDLLSAILRIDVDREENSKAYAVPPDNPFAKTPGVRPEIWAYGFRNPWRMSFDPKTDELWVGDVGWEQWEMVYRVQRGGNYGWSVMEGPQEVRPESRRGPTPILPPALAYPHTEGGSVTGGYVYHGKKFPELVGTYVFGDWLSRRLWGLKFDRERVLERRDLANSQVRVVAFGEDPDGELYIVHHEEKGTLHQLARNEARDTSSSFPRKLSQTGIFTNIVNHEVAPGVVPYSINAEPWCDHAQAERFIALPGDSSVRVYEKSVHVPGTAWFNSQYFFPKDALLVKTLSIEFERGQPQSRRRMETQVLHFDGQEWRGYSYRWNQEQTDADLVPSAGQEEPLVIKDAAAPGGRRKQTWHFSGRGECLQCHNPWAGFNLGFTLPQLHRAENNGSSSASQLTRLRLQGILTPAWEKQGNEPHPLDRPPKAMANLHDATADVDTRARSYLHANCAHCHQFGAGGTANLSLRFDIPLEETRALEARPVQGTFGIANAQLLAAGDPYRSIVYYRISKTGRGRMPHLGSELVDGPGVKVIHDWIRQLPVRKDDRALVDKLATLTKPDQGKDRTETVNRLLASPSTALMLLKAIDDGRLPEAVRSEVIAFAAARNEPEIRDLFERFVPDEQRIKRLGTVFKAEELLARKGDAARGKELFFKSTVLQCINCHKVGSEGHTVGPELTQVGKKLTRAQILESILQPSKTIDPQYLIHLVETTEGQLFAGVLVRKNDQEVVLKQASDKEIKVPTAKVERLVPQPKSLMPELLLKDLTPEQAADLIEYLAGLR